MDNAVAQVIREYELRGEAEDKLMRELDPAEAMRRRDQFLLWVGPNTAQLLNILVKEIGARTVLELGTSYGYSTVWLAEAARATGGRVITSDVDAGKQDFARAAIGKAGLASHVEFRCGDARETIAALEGTINFVLLDLWKELYIECFELFYPKLSPGALIAADNIIWPELVRKDALEYRRHVRTRDHIESVLLPVGSGIELSRYTRGTDFV